MDARFIFLLLCALFVESSAREISVITPVRIQEAGAVDDTGVGSGLYDGIDLSTLTESELVSLADAEDEIMKGYLDIHAYTNGLAEKSRRPKRWGSLAARAAFRAGRALFRSFSRGRVTNSGSRLTRQYHRAGNYNDAVRDFRSLNPSGVRSISNNRLQGMTGTLGRHRVTARSSSSSGRPTLEIRSPRNSGETVRKFRYNRE